MNSPKSKRSYALFPRGCSAFSFGADNNMIWGFQQCLVLSSEEGTSGLWQLTPRQPEPGTGVNSSGKIHIALYVEFLTEKESDVNCVNPNHQNNSA